jgi:hypothetical protein
MAKTKISEYSATPADNTDISNINIAEGCSPANVNNAIRSLMAQIKDLQAGTSGDTIPLTAGGTGSTTASAARTALSAAAAGANSDITSLTGLTTALTVAQGGTGSANTTTARANLGLTIGTDVAGFAYVQSFTKAQRVTPVALTSTSASIAVDASLSNNFTHTFTENTTLANPTNLVAGQGGVIVFTQHASSPKTLAFGSNWKFSSGIAPTVTATNSAVDVLVYYVESSSRITAKLISDVK